MNRTSHVARLVASFGFAALIAGTVGASGCDKPNEDSCRKALKNIQHLVGTDNLANANTGDFETQVRRCRGTSKKESVACATRAQSLDALMACNFLAATTLEKMKAATMPLMPEPAVVPTLTPVPAVVPTPPPAPAPSGTVEPMSGSGAGSGSGTPSAAPAH